MLIKVVAKNHRTGLSQWFGDKDGDNIYTDGKECYMNFEHKGLQKLKDPIEIWVSIEDDPLGFVCVFEKDTPTEN